jgi:hypothetical protein
VSQTGKNCLNCKYNDIRQGFQEPCKSCMGSDAWYTKWEPQNMNGKPTVKEIEEYMAALNLPEQSFNGTTAYDIVKEYNSVSKPKHYMLFDEFQIKSKAQEGKGIEVRDAIEMLVLKMEPHDGLFQSDYVQLMQYLMRFMDKNGKEDLEKARWYLDKMISAY